MQAKPRDVVVVRVSEQGDREDENFHSPKAQLARAKLWSEDQGNRVVGAFEEIDVSGKLPLAERPGLLRAIEMAEAGEADHIVAAYFDRLVRSLKVQLEVIERVERAGGEIYAIDHGRLTNGTAATRMSNQYYAEVTGEKVQAAQQRVVARGVLPNSRISPGYLRGQDGVLVVERPKARVVVRGASDERRSRPTASRRWCWTRSGATPSRPTRANARRAGSRSARRTRRSNARARISMTRSGSSASLNC
jgi:DNA invertase Pin-like site-specific DNA recombinase